MITFCNSNEMRRRQIKFSNNYIQTEVILVGVVALISRTACLLKHAQQEPVLSCAQNTAYRSRGVMTPTFSSKLSVIFNYILAVRKIWYHSK